MSRTLRDIPDGTAVMLDANILVLTYRDLHASRTFREQHGLMVNDSLTVAVMQRERLDFLATNDPDFQRVPGLAVRVPAP